MSTHYYIPHNVFLPFINNILSIDACRQLHSSVVIEDQVAKKATSNLAASSSEDRGMDQETDHHMEDTR